ncbi:MAG: hypothetical protein N3E51_02705 [Candidatus Micrarchaeota archaeon]|nr:hypothetical protein [Candidatus Micrarchaeota archaeon]
MACFIFLGRERKRMGLAARLAVAFLLLSSLSFPYEIKSSREELLAQYYAHIDPKIPKSARAILGDEKVNVIVGRQVIGIETKRGQLSYFEFQPVKNPTIVIIISEEAAEKMARGESGLLAALESGGVRIEPKNLLSAIKVETIKRIYAASGADEKIFGHKKSPSALLPSVNSIAARIRIAAG